MQQVTTETSRQQARRMAEECLGTRIERLHRLVSRRFDAELRPLGLTLPQIEVLSVLTLADAAARPSQIAGWLGLERSTVSRNLDVLAQRGLVRPAATSATGRTTTVLVTDAGCQALADAEAGWLRAHAWLSEALGPDAAGVLDQWLSRLGAPSM